MEPAVDSAMETVRFTSESLSGTPTTTESEELRTDRMSGGLVATGLEVGGDINGELARDPFYDDFFEAGMMSTWVAEEVLSTVTVDLTPDGSDPQKAVLTLGTEFPNLTPGVVCRFTPTGLDPVTVSIVSVDTPSTVFTVATMRDQAAVSDTLDVSIPSYCDIGKTINSFVISKAYQDVLHDVTTDEHSQTYTGELVDGFTVNAAYGEIMTTTFATVGNGYLQEAPSYSQQVITAGGTVAPAGTSQQLNASIDVPLVIASETGESTDYCIESLEIALTNNLDPQNCIGKIAATNYALGTARVAITASIYLSDTSYDALMTPKLELTPIAITYQTENEDGGYIFHMPQVQLVFPDPAAEGQDQQTMLEATGSAKVGENGESSLRVYRI